MFKLEQEEYLQEGISWTHQNFKDNERTIEMIESERQPSIFKLLDEQFMLAASGTDQKLYDGMFQQLQIYNKILNKPADDRYTTTKFAISHFAGDVTYNVEGFVEKNKDSESELILQALASSK